MKYSLGPERLSRVQDYFLSDIADINTDSIIHLNREKDNYKNETLGNNLKNYIKSGTHLKLINFKNNNNNKNYIANSIIEFLDSENNSNLDPSNEKYQKIVEKVE